jgi:AcrR family transcriptional regulator
VNGHLDVLPRGRHHLTREQVHASQRGRMLRGMVDAVAEKGYARTTVADVLERARASRETFYEHFANKEECFLAAYEESVQRLTGRLEGSLGDGDPPMVRFERVLDAYLAVMAAEPEIAQIFLIEVYAAGPAARQRRAEVLRQFGDILYELLGDAQELENLPDPRFAARAAVAAISGLVTSMVAAGDYASLPELKAPILELIGAWSAVD